jgi:hypothetical protein
MTPPQNSNHNPPPDSQVEPLPEAWIGLDWGNQQHAFALQDRSGRCERGTLEHSSENLHQWLGQIGQHYGGRPVALALEASRGAVVHALLNYAWLTIYPINPITSARYRQAFTPSGAKDDLPDADVLLELVRDHAVKLRPLEVQDAPTVKLAELVHARRDIVDRRTQTINQTTSLLKTYYPQALELAGGLDRDMALDFLSRWPDVISLKAVRPATLKRFYHQHNVRSTQLVEERLQFIQKAVALTTQEARVSVAVHRLHCFHPQDAQVGLPAVEPEERIMIGTESRGQTLPGDGLVEHAAEHGTVDGHRLHPKADDPAAKLIHDDQNPVTPQQDRFGPEQIQAPETVLGMTQERKPRRSEVTAFGAVVCGQNSTHHIFVEVDTKGLGQVLRDLRAAEAGVAPLDFTDGLDQFR